MTTKQYTITIERRRDVRQRVHLNAQIMIDETDTVLPCTIANMSKSGIKIDLADDAPLPEHFVVKELTLGTEFECALQWRNGTEVGLKFMRVSNLDNLDKLLQAAE